MRDYILKSFSILMVLGILASNQHLISIFVQMARSDCHLNMNSDMCSIQMSCCNNFSLQKEPCTCSPNQYNGSRQDGESFLIQSCSSSETTYIVTTVGGKYYSPVLIGEIDYLPNTHDLFFVTLHLNESPYLSSIDHPPKV